MPTKKRTFRSFNPAWDNSESANDRRDSEHVMLGTISATATRTIFRAKSEVVIKQITLLVETTVTANDTNYWSFQVKNITKVVPTLLSAAVTTQATGGATMTAYVKFDLNPDQYLYLAPNDVLELVATKTASASNLVNLVVATDYEVTGETTSTSSSTTTTTSTSTSSTTTTTTTTTTTISTTTS